MEKIKVRNKRIDEELFEKWRQSKKLPEWPTSKEFDYDDALAYQKSLPDNKIWWKVMAKLTEEGRMTVWPRGGTPLLEDMIHLCQSLVATGVRLIPITTDTYTRTRRYADIEKQLEEMKKTGKTTLNGYPIVNHGIKKTRKIIESCPEGAFSLRAGPAEFGIAAGCTTGGGSGFGWYLQRGQPAEELEASIVRGQYSSRESGWYADRGVILCADDHGFQPQGPIPPAVMIVGHILAVLGSAEQGHKASTPIVFCLGNMAQDMASIRLAPRLMREYLDKFGYKDFLIPGIIACQIPLFPVPQDIGGAFAYLCYVAMVGSLSRCSAVDLRSIDEGAGIPTEEAHKMSWRAAKWIFDVVREQKIEISVKDVEAEEKITEAEVRAIMDKILELGDGDICVGFIRAMEAGVVDMPWNSQTSFEDAAIGVRDVKGAWRYLDFGNLPIPKEIKEFHRQKVAEREKKESKKVDYYTAVHDFLAFSKGKIVGLPPYDK